MKNIKPYILKSLILVSMIVLCFVSYYSYLSYVKYTVAKDKATFSHFLGELESTYNNLNLERIDTARYLALDNKVSNAKKLSKRRVVVDTSIDNWVYFIEKHQTFEYFNAHIEELKLLLKAVRKEVDLDETSHNSILVRGYHDDFLSLSIEIMHELTRMEKPTDIDEYLRLYKTYFVLRENTILENTYIHFFLFSSAVMKGDDILIWENLKSKDKLPLDNNEIAGELSVSDYQNILMLERDMILSESRRGKYSVSVEGWQDKMEIKNHYYQKIESKLRIQISETEDSYVNRCFLTMLGYGLGILFLIFVIYKLLSTYAVVTKNKFVSPDTLKDIALVFNDSQQKEIKRLIKQGNIDHIYRFLIQAIKDANQTKDLFLASMSHEIRTPLNGILGFTQLLKDSEEKEEQLEFISVIEKSSENLLTIVNDILDLSKIKAEKIELENIIFDPVVSFESAVENYAAKAAEESIDLNVYIDPSLPTELKGDPTKISQIIVNLMSNALKFTSKHGEVNVNIVKLEENKEKIKIKFSISDNGIGISEEQKKNIFNAFTQADVSTSRKYGGTGLGLSISGKFVELMGGTLDIHSVIHEGSTFFFILSLAKSDESKKRDVPFLSKFTVGILNPHIDDEYFINKNLETYIQYIGASVVHYTDETLLALNNSSLLPDILFIDQKFRQRGEEIEKFLDINTKIVVLSTADQKRNLNRYKSRIDKVLYKPINFTKTLKILTQKKEIIEDKKKLYFNNIHILVVEDNLINQKLIFSLLHKLGIEVSMASNGKEAFEMRMEHKYDMIFMDIEMPIMGGMEASGKILLYEKNSHEEHIPIVALTANALSGDREKYIGAGMDNYLSKPIQLEILHKLLREYFEDSVI